MTTDDVDSGENYVDYAESVDHKNAKWGKFKDALSRTKTKINKAKDDWEAKRQQQLQEKAAAKLKQDDEVDDFLSTGRPSFASSQRPSVISGTHPSEETSSISPRPSTSDSNTLPSPRRGPPVTVPRIDVSGFTRFPNAKPVDPNDVLLTPGASNVLGTGSISISSLLKPEYKSRSQSASSLASGTRRARIRNLSVGFVDVPPVIIGEGGDEAEAPPMEISRAKERARSASPQGRRPYMNATVQPEARKQMPNRGFSDMTADAFVPKPFTRTQTGASLEGKPSKVAPRGPHDDGDFVPKPFARAQAGASLESKNVNAVRGEGQDGLMPEPFSRARPGIPDQRSPQPPRQGPHVPVPSLQPAFIPSTLGTIQPGTLDLTKEFEMTLGLGSTGSNSPSASKSLGEPAQIFAPKPKRAPPSYDLIEGVGKALLAKQGPSPPSQAYQQTSHITPPKAPEHVSRRPVATSNHNDIQLSTQPSHKVDHVNLPQPQQQVMPSPLQVSRQEASQHPLPHMRAQNTARVSPQPLPQHQRQQSQDTSRISPQPPTQAYYPPPPQRTATQTARIPQKLERISPKPQQAAFDAQQETGVARDLAQVPDPRRPTSIVTNHDNGYRSFADRQKAHVGGGLHAHAPASRQQPSANTIRQVPIEEYAESPSSYSTSIGNTPQSATVQTPGRRFYEEINRGNAPGGFI